MRFSALQRAEIAEMFLDQNNPARRFDVSVLFNEPKLLKSDQSPAQPRPAPSFSALQRAEIAEIYSKHSNQSHTCSFSALQRAEIAEIAFSKRALSRQLEVSVLFNEPKLLKFPYAIVELLRVRGFSALQRAEIAEICVPLETPDDVGDVSVLFNEPKLLKLWYSMSVINYHSVVSVLFNEPKLLK